MKVSVLTLFPEVVAAYLSVSILGNATGKGLLSVETTDIRDFAEGKHRQVDDRPFGGGPGMVLMPGPVVRAVEAARAGHDPAAPTILLTPQGERFGQKLAVELAAAPGMILVCGRYEGFDERIRTVLNPREISLGDFVLAGGELAALAVVEATARLLPGVLGHEESARHDSFSAESHSVDSSVQGGLLEGPQYTRPRDFRGHGVPEVLFSGNHAEIEAWRHAQALARTRTRRADLLPNEPNETGT